jgi:hypothetical protein
MSTRFEKHASLSTQQKVHIQLKMTKLCQIKQFTMACTEKLASKALDGTPPVGKATID